MKTAVLANKNWKLSINPSTGAIASLGNAGDRYGMNWICDSAENSWFQDSQGWGLGFLAMPGGNGPQRWQRPVSIKVAATSATVRYRVRTMDVTVVRRLRGDSFEETFEFRNRSKLEQPIWGIGLYTPFNDNYPDARTCVTRRCNAHLWCGGNSAYACCMRMGGEAPHLGLVLTDGFLGGYSIEGRGLLNAGSNVRGCIVMNARGLTLAPGAVHRIGWRCFWHGGWDDFLSKARRISGFAEVKASQYTVVKGQPLEISSSVPGARIDKLDGKAGEHTLKVKYGKGLETWLCVNVIDDIAALVRSRAAFIRDRQLVTDRRSPFYGAFLSYDNDVDAQFHNPDWPDQGEGREHIGMSVLLAQQLRKRLDSRTAAVLKLHHRFVRTRLQAADGTVFSSVNDRKTQRLYNYPWVAQFHLEMYRAFGDRKYLTDCFRTLRTYYRRGGEKFYAIGIPMVDAVDIFLKAGLKKEAGLLLKDFLRHGDKVVETGLDFPPHEVNYEQTIVGPAVIIALECYLLSHDEKYLKCAKLIMPALESFNGRQPDHHLHEIAIRHWDGFWFGGKRNWGDTFPHYWSAQTGWVFYRYWQATGDDSYRSRGRQILMNNLSAFSADGRARCVYIYPDAVNGNPMRFWDPLANDQDWAMVFLMQAAEVDKGLMSGK